MFVRFKLPEMFYKYVKQILNLTFLDKEKDISSLLFYIKIYQVSYYKSILDIIESIQNKNI